MHLCPNCYAGGDDEAGLSSGGALSSGRQGVGRLAARSLADAIDLDKTISLGCGAYGTVRLQVHNMQADAVLRESVLSWDSKSISSHGSTDLMPGSLDHSLLHWELFL